MQRKQESQARRRLPRPGRRDPLRPRRAQRRSGRTARGHADRHRVRRRLRDAPGRPGRVPVERRHHQERRAERRAHARCGKRSSTARRSSASTASRPSRRSSTTRTPRRARLPRGGCGAASSASSGRARCTARRSRRCRPSSNPVYRADAAYALGEFFATPGIAACATALDDRQPTRACAPPRRARSGA